MLWYSWIIDLKLYDELEKKTKNVHHCKTALTLLTPIVAHIGAPHSST